MRNPKTGLGLEPETEGMLWSVRTSAHTYLVVADRSGLYDVHRVDGVGIEHVGAAGSQTAALELVRDDLG